MRAILVSSGLSRVFFHKISIKHIPPSTYSWLLYDGQVCVCVGSLTIGGEEEVCGVLLRQPSDLIDLLLDLQTLKVVKLGLMALKGAVDIVLSL